MTQIVALRTSLDRLERCAVVGGTDLEFAAAAVAEDRALLEAGA